MNVATDRMTQILQARGWAFKVDAESELIRTGCQGVNGQWQIRTGGFGDAAVVTLSFFPVNCPAARRSACAELLTWINFDLEAVCFEMDFRDGEILCKTFVPYDQEVPPVELLDKLFSLNLSVMDDFLPVIMQVIYVGVSPAKALADFQKAEAAKQVQTNSSKEAVQSRFPMN